MNIATVRTGTISAQGPIVTTLESGRVCVDVGGRIVCGERIEPLRRDTPAEWPGVIAKVASTVLLAIGSLLAAPASAEECMKVSREILVSYLEDLGERQVGAGIVADVEGVVNEVFVNPQTGTWTIIASNTLGVSCIGAHGTGWTGIRSGVAS